MNRRNFIGVIAGLIGAALVRRSEAVVPVSTRVDAYNYLGWTEGENGHPIIWAQTSEGTFTNDGSGWEPI